MMNKKKTHYTPDGKAYNGPTHKSGNMLMTGAKHTASSKMLSASPPKPKKKK